MKPVGRALLILNLCAASFAADQDGDGWGKTEDCDDQNAAVHPEAPDACDGLDNDCNGTTDDYQVQLFEGSVSWVTSDVHPPSDGTAALWEYELAEGSSWSYGVIARVTGCYQTVAWNVPDGWGCSVDAEMNAWSTDRGSRYYWLGSCRVPDAGPPAPLTLAVSGEDSTVSDVLTTQLTSVDELPDDIHLNLPEHVQVGQTYKGAIDIGETSVTDPLTWSVTGDVVPGLSIVRGGPDWLVSIDTLKGDAGSYDFQVTATDDEGNTTSEDEHVRVCGCRTTSGSSPLIWAWTLPSLLLLLHRRRHFDATNPDNASVRSVFSVLKPTTKP